MTDKIIMVIEDVLKTPVDIETSQDNCHKWDSLRHLNIIMAIEDTFEVLFEPEDIAKMKNVQDIERFIVDYQTNKNGQSI